MSGKYIVVFKEHVTQDQIQEYVSSIQENGGSVTQQYGSVLNGFAATIPDSYLTELQSLQGDVIDYIEPDSVVTTQGQILAMKW